MPLALLDEEKEVVDRVLWFANLKRIHSTGQIEKKFSALRLVPGIFKIIPPKDLWAYRKDQEELRSWLTKIITGRPLDRKELESVITMRLSETIDTRLGLVNGRLIYQYGLTGVQAAYALGVALMLDDRRGLSQRLKQCGNRECQRFNCDLKPKGRPRRFCNAECKRRFDNQTAAVRVSNYRERHRL